jgi:hypothetical protein
MDGKSNREAIHRLVNELPEDRLARARLALERLKLEKERVPVNRDDVETIDALADELNAEAEDVLGYQADW